MKQRVDPNLMVVGVVALLAFVTIMGMYKINDEQVIYLTGTQYAPVISHSEPALEQPALEQPAALEPAIEEKPLEETVLHVHDDGTLHDHSLDLAAPSITERYYDEFWRKVSKYSFKVTCGVHGRMSVSATEEKITYRSLEYYFILDQETNDTSESGYSTDLARCLKKDKEDWTPLAKSFLSDIKKKNIAAFNYVEFSVADDQYKGCFIVVGGSLASCVQNSSGEPVIYENFSFMHPKAPHDYLIDFAGKEPYKIETDRQLVTRDAESKISVEELYFRTGDDITVLYVHSYYKIPLKIDTIEDGVVYATEFDDMSYTLNGIA